MANRKEELLNLIDGDEELLIQLVNEILFLENQLIALKKLPFIKVNPKDPTMQKATPAARQYKEFLQQYTNCIKILAKASGLDAEDEESPLRKWVNMRMGGGSNC